MRREIEKNPRQVGLFFLVLAAPRSQLPHRKIASQPNGNPKYRRRYQFSVATRGLDRIQSLGGLDQTGDECESRVDLVGLRAAGLGEVGPTAAAAAAKLGHRSNQVTRL